MKHKKLKVWIIAGIALVATLYIIQININNTFQTYKFAMNKVENPQYFEGEYTNRGLNSEVYAINNVVNKYSPLTEILFPDMQAEDMIKIEHAVQVSAVDLININDLEDDHYFFSAIEIPKNINVNRIDLDNYYKGDKLEVWGTYLYIYEEDKNGRVTYGKPQVIHISETSNEISEQGHYVFVKIFKFPKVQTLTLHNILVPKINWFNKEIDQKITIQYLNNVGGAESTNYSFRLHWVKWMSLLDKILTIT